MKAENRKPKQRTAGTTKRRIDPTETGNARQTKRRGKTAAQKLQERKWFRTLIDHFYGAIEVIDPENGRFLEANVTALRDLGYSREELLALTIFDVNPNLDRTTFVRCGKQLQETGLCDIEGLHRRKDGSTYPVSAKLKLVELDREFIVAVTHDNTEHQRVEREILESRMMLKRVIDNIPQYVFWKDKNLNYLGANIAFVRSAGLKESADIVGKSDFDLSWKESAESYRADDRAVIETGVSKLNYEERQIRPDGSVWWLRTSKLLLIDDAGKAIGMLGIYEEITEQKKLEKALQESSQFSQQVIDCAREGIVVYNLDLTYRYWNRFMEELTGCAASGVLGKHFQELFPFLSETEIPSSLRKALAGETNRSSDFHFHIPRTGKSAWVSHLTGPLRNAAGEIIGVIATVRNITQYKRAEDALRQSEANLANAQHIVHLGSWEWSILEDKLYWSDEAYRIVGLLRQAHPRPYDEFRKIVHPADRAAVDKAVQECLAGKGPYNIEHRIVRPDGSERVVHELGEVIRDETGQPIRMVGTTLDITERKILEMEFLQAQKMEAIGQLAAGIAHDFNNVLAPIVMAGSLLRTKAADPSSQHILDIVEQSSARGAGLVRQMLSFARGNLGEKKLLQVSHILREVIDLAESTFPKSIRVESHLPNDLWTVMCDPSQIHQVFLNLCINARDAMPEGGELTLTAANRTLNAAEAAKIPDGRPGSFLKIDVRDTGTGIPPEVLERIWNPFFTTKGPGKGTGLGLSTVRGILAHHEGFATVVTSGKGGSNRGTLFTVYLPAVAEGTARGGGTIKGHAPKRGAGELILLVDDEKSVREMGARILANHGYRAITATDGANAIEVFTPHASEVRLVLADLQMPNVDGWALAAALRKLNPTLPVIAMSGGMTQGRESKIPFGTAYLPKPFDANALLSIVRRTLDDAALAAVPHKT
jgi:PAS domain S-box-containing protein